MIKMNVKRLSGRAKLPTYATNGAACMDMYACLPEGQHDIEVIAPHERVLIPTGIAVEVPEGYVLEVLMRSGLALREGLTLLNGPGQIDEDYRGEIKLIVYNADPQYPAIIKHGDRIGQCRLLPVYPIHFCEVDELSETARGAGGFGHTGK